MDFSYAAHDRAVQRLYELVRRVNSASGDLDEILTEIAKGVVEVLGYGFAAISQLSGDEFVVTTAAGDPDACEELIGRRIPAEHFQGEFAMADDWGILSYLPHDRASEVAVTEAWVPDLPMDDGPDAWHPLDSLHAPLYSATGDLLGNVLLDLPPGNKIPSIADRQLLEMFVVQAGIALSNAQQRAELARRMRFTETVKRVATGGSILTADRMLTDAAAAIGEGLQATEILISGFDTRDGGHAAQWPPLPRRMTAEVGLLRRTTEMLARSGGEPLLIPGRSQEAEGLVVVTGYDPTWIRGVLDVDADVDLVVAPVIVGSEALGCLVVSWGSPPHHPDADEIAAIAEIGRELGRKLQHTRLFESEHRVVSELRELDKYRTELIATISHELKTPLTAIIGHAELLDGELARMETGHASLASIQRNAQRLDKLTRRLLDYSRVHEPTTHVASQVDLVDLVDDAAERFAGMAADADIRVDIHHQGGHTVVLGDEEELTLVLDNLLGNAIKYSAAGGRVRLETRMDGDHAEVVCADNGIGISAVDLEHVFSAFHRSTNPAAQSLPGTGLGLAIARRIAQIHGGEIQVESRLGEGSTFRLRLPAQQVTDEVKDVALG